MSTHRGIPGWTISGVREVVKGVLRTSSGNFAPLLCLPACWPTHWRMDRCTHRAPSAQSRVLQRRRDCVSLCLCRPEGLVSRRRRRIEEVGKYRRPGYKSSRGRDNFKMYKRRLSNGQSNQSSRGSRRNTGRRKVLKVQQKKFIIIDRSLSLRKSWYVGLHQRLVSVRIILLKALIRTLYS